MAYTTHLWCFWMFLFVVAPDGIAVGSDFFLLSRSWPGQYRRFILGDAKRR